MADDSVKITAEIPQPLYDRLVALATERGLTANTVLQQALQNEFFFSDKEHQGGTILIEQPNRTFEKVTLSSTASS